MLAIVPNRSEEFLEPSPETFREMGRLCAAYSYLETVCEHTLWGVLEADDRWGQLVSSRLDLRGLWDLLLTEATKKLDDAAIKELKAINKDLTTVMRDRNVIVHGRIHAAVWMDSKPPTYTIMGPAGLSYDFAQVPCWTIFKGSAAAKCYPISTKAVEIVRLNIAAIAERMIAFNKRYGHFKGQEAKVGIETGWPVALE